MAGVVPQLKIGAKLGNGSFGEVFLGDHSIHGQVAVKVISRQTSHTDAEWDKFKANALAEARKLAKASHPNVVKVYDIEEATDDQSIRFCMAYCPGGSLQSQFELAPMLLLDVRNVATEVLLGLEALHGRQMLHRDIKPGNILLDASGVALISDFGLVTDDLVLGYGSAAGYADHVAYEMWSSGLSSVKTDIWALGMTLYRLVHGKEWYDEGPPPHTLVRKGKFSETLRWLPHVPKSWRRLIKKMMNDDPSLRYASANKASNALAELETPAWRTAVSRKLIRWDREKANRRQIVEWTRLSDRQHQWRAWSEPLTGTGITRTLGESAGVVTKKVALKGLDTFFARNG
jgi:serine/threonine-protein kinase